LTLNSPEIYALTIGLKLLSKDTVFQEPLAKIANQIYSQLSDFGHNMIDKKAKEAGISMKETEREFVCSADFARQDTKPFCQYLRDSRLCKVIYMDNNTPIEVIGSLHICNDENDRLKKVIVRSAAEDLVLPINDILDIQPD
ncbi:MAG: hypothetical protein ACM3ZR_09030, partial [Pseudomonadota bacterium]